MTGEKHEPLSEVLRLIATIDDRDARIRELEAQACRCDVLTAEEGGGTDSRECPQHAASDRRIRELEEALTTAADMLEEVVSYDSDMPGEEPWDRADDIIEKSRALAARRRVT